MLPRKPEKPKETTEVNFVKSKAKLNSKKVQMIFDLRCEYRSHGRQRCSWQNIEFGNVNTCAAEI